MQQVDLGLRLVLQQPFTHRAVSLGLHGEQIRTAGIQPQLVLQQCQRSLVLRGLEQRADIGVHERTRIGVAHRGVLQERYRRDAIAPALQHPRMQGIDHGIADRTRTQFFRLAPGLRHLLVAQQRHRVAETRRRLVREAPLLQHRPEVGDGLARVPGFSTQLRPDKMEFNAVGMLPVGCVLRPVLRVRNPVRCKGVRAKVAGRLTVVRYPGIALQLLKERGHAAHIEPRGLQRGESDPVCLALEIARIAELPLDRRPLRRHGRARSQVRTRARSQECRSERDHRRHLHLLRRPDLPCNVPLRYVRHLMREDRRHFGLGVGGGQQPGMHADESAW